MARFIVAIFLLLVWTCCGFAQSGAIYNPPSTLTLTSATSAYSASQLIANSATAASVTVPSIPTPSVSGGFTIPRVRLDTEYALGWSVWGDLRIMMMTVPAVVLRRGAV